MCSGDKGNVGKSGLVLTVLYARYCSSARHSARASGDSTVWSCNLWKNISNSVSTSSFLIFGGILKSGSLDNTSFSVSVNEIEERLMMYLWLKMFLPYLLCLSLTMLPEYLSNKLLR